MLKVKLGEVLNELDGARERIDRDCIPGRLVWSFLPNILGGCRRCRWTINLVAFKVEVIVSSLHLMGWLLGYWLNRQKKIQAQKQNTHTAPNTLNHMGSGSC